jgi:hypothetical protein
LSYYRIFYIVYISELVLDKKFYCYSEARGGWKNLRNEELSNIYLSPNVIRINKLMGWKEIVARVGGEGNCIQSFGRTL